MNNQLQEIKYNGENFKGFINIENNKRIFFSGRFGIGKTMFLKRFFEANYSDFEVFHLFPSKYQISSSDNIIDLFKYDIVTELYGKDGNIFETRTISGLRDWGLMFSLFLKEKCSLNQFLQSSIDVGGNLLSIFPSQFSQSINQLGKTLKDTLEFDKELQKFKDDYKKYEQGIIDEFVKTISEKNLSTSNDIIGCLLSAKVNSIKGEKRSVLILDDFDRIDPEHIFRILNTLSVSVNGGEDNLLGFDHVIIVGDINNIKNIFKHKYGSEVDFGGYLDKFFTITPYIFDNKKAIAENISMILSSVKCHDEIKPALTAGDGITHGILNEIITRANTLDKINLRQLYKPVNYHFQEVNIKRSNDFTQRKQFFDIGINLLVAIFEGNKNLLSLMEEIKNMENRINQDFPYSDYINIIFGALPDTPASDTNTYYLNHNIKIKNDDYDNKIPELVSNSIGAKAEFFYSLLYEYIRREVYTKNRY
jgi:hypothetical protein